MILASIYQAVRTIAVYLLFSSVLLGILQESPYKPYVRLFTSLLLVLFMVRSVSFLSFDEKIEHILEQAVEADDFSAKLQKAQQAGQEKITEQLIEEVKKKAIIFLEEFGYEVLDIEIKLAQDYQIEEMKLELKWKKQEKDSTGKEKNFLDKQMDKKELKIALAKYFSINQENIAIKIALAGGDAYGKMDRGTW